MEELYLTMECQLANAGGIRKIAAPASTFVMIKSGKNH